MRFKTTRILAFGMWIALAAIAITAFAAFDPATDAAPAPTPVEGREGVVGMAPSALFDFEVPTATSATSPPSTSTQPRPTTVAPAAPSSAPTSTSTSTSTSTTVPEPTTTTTPEPRPASTVHPPEVEAWRPLVEAYFPVAEVDRALEVMWCESRGEPAATNPSSGAAGLFQHMPPFWEERSVPAGFPGADIYDPEANVGVAAWLVATDGWKHWYPSLHCWG